MKLPLRLAALVGSIALVPALSADPFGDWREGIIPRANDGKELRISTTTISRRAVARPNTAYNQPPPPSFYLDEAAPLPQRSNIITVSKR